MIKGRVKENLTLDNILKRVTEYDIYRHYIGKDFQLGTCVHSPMREDKNPSFFIGSRGGFIHHTDLARKDITGNCVQLVQQMYMLNFDEALAKIDQDLGLGIRTGTKSVFTRVWKVPQKPPKEETIIKVRSRRMDSSDLAYWAQFYLTEQDLREENVYAVKELVINNERIPLKPTELCFGYLLEDKWKIYWPNRVKGEKWRTNMPITMIDGLENLKGAKTGLIIKSKKDKMVAKKFLTKHVAAVQNESTSCISPQQIEWLQENVDDLYIIFDPDKTGVESCMYYNQFGFKYWNLPQSYMTEGVKDIAEFVAKYGPDKLREEVSKKIKL